MGYWHKILSGAWDKTYLPLGWDRKKIALGLVSLCGVVVVGVHFGWEAMTASASPLLWTISPVFFAALILFVWGIVETQAKLYAELSTSSSAKITELEAALSGSQEPPPNYEAWRHVHELHVRQAAFLWNELEPRMSQPPKIFAWSSALQAAIKKGELDFVPQYSDYGRREVQLAEQRKAAWSETFVTREHLKAFAKLHNYDPIFLRDD